MPTPTEKDFQNHQTTLSSSRKVTSRFEVSAEDLKKLMECRGNDGVNSLTNRFKNVEGLCKRLRTDPIQGRL